MSLTAGIITKDQEMICPVDATGHFTDDIVDFKKEYVKVCDNYCYDSGYLCNTYVSTITTLECALWNVYVTLAAEFQNIRECRNPVKSGMSASACW